MVKILSQSGISLADVYDIEGSIVGVDSLQAREVQLVHEMGQTIFSERITGDVERITSGAIAQSTNFNTVLATFGVGVTRILGVLVLTTATSRLSMVTVLVRDAFAGREIPIFVWDSNEDNVSIRIEEDGGGVAGSTVLGSSLNLGVVPTMLIGADQPARSVNEIAVRGATAAFGAGTVTTTAMIYTAHTAVPGMGVSSYGLPVPSW